MTHTEIDKIVQTAIKPLSPKKPYLPPNLRPNLTGRKVYFLMGKKQFKIEKNIFALTPGKLYTILEERDICPTFKLVQIENNAGIYISILLGDTCAHLDFLTKWILQREPKKPATPKVSDNDKYKYIGHPEQLSPMPPIK